MKNLIIFTFCLALFSCKSPEEMSIKELIEEISLSTAEENKELNKILHSKIKKADYGIFEDKRDNKKYNTIVMLDNNTWFAENLRFNSSDISRYCYDESDNNCETYGGLYKYDDALKACPEGWRLPSEEDWINLFSKYGGATVAWDFDSEGDGKKTYKNLKNETKFNVLLCGSGAIYKSGKQTFRDKLAQVQYWSSTISNNEKIISFTFGGRATKSVTRYRGVFQSQRNRDLRYCRCIKNQ